MMSFRREEFVSGKENENGLGLRLGSGFRCGVMENGGRFHGYSGSPQTPRPRPSYLDHPSKFKMRPKLQELGWP